MKTYKDWYAYFLRQALHAARRVGADDIEVPVGSILVSKVFDSSI